MDPFNEFLTWVWAVVFSYGVKSYIKIVSHSVTTVVGLNGDVFCVVFYVNPITLCDWP